MNISVLDNTKSGRKIPAICVPLTGADRQQLAEEIQLANELPCQLVEWRADYLMASMKEKSFWNVTRELLKTLGFIKSMIEKPVIFTIRTDREGGETEIAEENYFFINRMVAESRMADMIDIEALACVDSQHVSEFISCAHEHETAVILSNHDFNKTPAVETIVDKYEAMISMGGDIAKVAVMPETEDDVEVLLEAAAIVHERYPRQMLIAISMGELGMVSRICAGHMGSVITFAAGRESSAPGQIDAVTLQGYLEQYYK